MEKKSKLLHVTSILMVIFGSISLLLGILALVGALAISAGTVDVGLGDISPGMVMGAAVLMLVGAVIQFVAGIVGVKNSSKPEKANVCIVFGILAALIVVIGIIIDIASGQATPFGLATSVIVSFVMPVLYLAGAFNLKKLANT